MIPKKTQRTVGGSVKLGEVAASVGKGLFAGAAGTAAMTVSSTLEMKIRGRQASNAPAQAASKVLGVEPTGKAEQARFSNLVHWGYGTSWGAVRGLIGASGLEGKEATTTFFGAIWGTEQVMLPALGVAPPLWQWGAKEVAIDAFHHFVYASATSVAYAALDR
jgi:hypothetical protein